MRRSVVLFLIVCAVVVRAQERPPAEVAISYSGLSLGSAGSPKLADFAGLAPRLTGGHAAGWSAGITKSMTPHIAVTVQADGNYGSFNQFTRFGEDARTRIANHSVAGGPIVVLTTGRLRPFVEALVGIGHISERLRSGDFFKISDSDTSATFIAGGGLALRVKQWDRLSLRSGMDWVRTNHFGHSQNNLRVTIGAAFSLSEPAQ